MEQSDRGVGNLAAAACHIHGTGQERETGGCNSPPCRVARQFPRHIGSAPARAVGPLYAPVRRGTEGRSCPLLSTSDNSHRLYRNRTHHSPFIRDLFCSSHNGPGEPCHRKSYGDLGSVRRGRPSDLPLQQPSRPWNIDTGPRGEKHIPCDREGAQADHRPGDRRY